MIRRIAAASVALVLAAALTGCDGADDSSDNEPTPTPSATAAPSPAKAAPAPKPGRCYSMSYADAVAPTTDGDSVACTGKHTTETYFVGSLDTVVDGHLVAVDSERVQAQVAAECPRRLSAFVGGTPEDLRLSMLFAVWFSPTVEESDEGQNWFRCDVVAIGAPDTLAPLAGPLKGALGTEQGRNTYGMCGTDRPGTQGFERVPCSRQHSWRAVSTVDIQGAKGGRWPGEAASREAGNDACEDAVRNEAADPLKFTWAFEWPSRKQWNAGQHFGFCWSPEA